jgi:hypothetical protein
MTADRGGIDLRRLKEQCRLKALPTLKPAVPGDLAIRLVQLWMPRRQPVVPGHQLHQADLHLAFLAVEHAALARRRLGTKAPE